MSLRKQQSLFAADTAKLFNWLVAKGYEWTYGEARRPLELQQIYVARGSSWTLNSYHINSLAIDLNIFLDGKLLTSKEDLQEIGDYWESLSPDNSWGGNWDKKFDTPHFERRNRG